ncbi:MAG: UDP-N-acetylmuramate dehydrogenase [Tepidisphaera sp.]|nr:UDP-N-acetylmuramate dehydrogenase [Tepidisphaera sp.]
MNMPAIMNIPITNHAPIRTWFGVGGGADRLAMPRDQQELEACVRLDPALRVLGAGANLLVDDDGVAELVVSLESPAFQGVEWGPELVRVGAGADLPKLIVEAVRRGRAGLEGLGGIPATLGGALVMNAGGAFGQIADCVTRVYGVSREGTSVTIERSQIDFGYRHSGLNELILTGAELRLPPGDPVALRDRLKEVMAYKKSSQPMADNSAGCCFKNPTLAHSVKDATGDIGGPGQRVSAGMLIDRAGLKGLAVRGASVSPRHANFLVTAPGAKARDVIELIELITRRVHDAFGVTLQPEVVIWRRS